MIHYKKEKKEKKRRKIQTYQRLEWYDEDIDLFVSYHTYIKALNRLITSIWN